MLVQIKLYISLCHLFLMMLCAEFCGMNIPFYALVLVVSLVVCHAAGVRCHLRLECPKMCDTLEGMVGKLSSAGWLSLSTWPFCVVTSRVASWEMWFIGGHFWKLSKLLLIFVSIVLFYYVHNWQFRHWGYINEQINRNPFPLTAYVLHDKN